MAFLLDTHTFLWFINGDKKLPISIKNKIEDTKIPCFLSVASLWEIAIKLQIKKLQINMSFEDLYKLAKQNDIEILEIGESHLNIFINVDFIHKDPFDRLIISQAISEDLILITKDKGLKNYNVKQQWA